MNCRELQSYFDAHSETGDMGGDWTEIQEHISTCADCPQFLQTRKETVARLQVLRESAPPVPGSLDAAVLASYRKQTTARLEREAQPNWRLGIARRGWGAAVAAGVVLLATVFILRKPPTVVKIEPPPHAVARSLKPVPTVASGPTQARNTAAVARKTMPKRRGVGTANDASSIAQNEFSDSLPSGFRSLMYCDELSCDGGMEVLRVQLPAPAAGFVPAPASGNRVVSADVLVGADGFARGIRIVH